MTIPLSVRMRSFFARDKGTFWFAHFTDEEKKLRRMDVWELAKVINEARVRNLAGEAEKLIVAEHMLNVRLAQIQSKASWGSGVLGFVGAIVGAALSVSLTYVLQTPNQALHASEQITKEQIITPSVKQSQKPAIHPPPKALTHHSSGTPNGAP